MGGSNAEGTRSVPDVKALLQSAKCSLRKQSYRAAWKEIEKVLQIDGGNAEAKTLRTQLERRRRRLRSSRLLLILPFVLAAIVLAPLALLKKSSEAEIVLKVSQVAFTLGEQGTNGLLNSINMASLRLLNFQTIELGPIALEIAAASGWRRIRPGGQTLITSKGAFTSATLADVTLNELSVRPGARMTLSSVEGEPRTLTVRIDGGTTTGKIAVSKRLHLSCDYCEVNNLLAQYDFDSKVLRLTHERQHEIGFSGRSETMTLTLELAPQAKFALKNVPVTGVDLTKQGEERSRTSTVIDNGGKIIFREFDKEEVKVEEADFVILDGLKNFHIKTLKFDGGINLVLHGQIGNLTMGSAAFIRDRLPSLLKWLYARETWILYVQALILTGVTVLAIFERLKILREED
jgi:hypothetical protein